MFYQKKLTRIQQHIVSYWHHLLCAIWLSGCAAPGGLNSEHGQAPNVPSATQPTLSEEQRTAVPPDHPNWSAPSVGASNNPLPAKQPSPLQPSPLANDCDLPSVVDMDTPNGFSPCGPDKDLWQRIRRGFAMKNLDGNLVDNQVQWYTTRPDYVDRMVSRSSRYLFYIVEALEKRQMPTELALLPFIESAFNPEAKSHAKAVGMWQFIPSTGKDFNLKQNIFRDERRDVLASTNAALDYLQRLYSQFGDWHLALAAYNWGEGSVARAIARNQRAGLPTDYLSLKMPAETRHYVPKLQAVKNLIAAPHIFSLKLPTIENHPYFVTATTRKDIDVDLAAQLARLPLDEFKALNPSFNRPIIIGATQPKILLPFKNAEIFHENLNTYRKPLASWTAIRVVGRERIDTLGKRLGVDPSILRTVNRIPKGMRLTPGSTLVVPRTTKMRADISQLIAENAQFGMEPDTKLRHKIYVKARKHDTVNTLAARYRVSAAHIRTWNRLTSNAVTPGKQVVLYLPNPPKRIAKKNRQTKIVQAADR